MRELVKYLLRVEKMAGDLYKDASAFFGEYKGLASFLSLLEEDEAYHFEVMTKADEYLRGITDETPAFLSLDSATKERIERPFIENRESLFAKTLNKEDIINLIVSTEFSEWNDVFLYVVNRLTHSSRKFEEAAANIQEHKHRIETYLESLPDGHKHLKKIRSLPAVWEQKILVVEDDAVIVELLSTILGREYIVQSAENGKRGLEKIRGHHFDVIISDVDMPVMDGLEFFQQALKVDHNIGERFLFFTGYPTPENLSLFARYNLQYMTKPVELDQIKRVVRDMMHGGSKDH